MAPAHCIVPQLQLDTYEMELFHTLTIQLFHPSLVCECETIENILLTQLQWNDETSVNIYEQQLLKQSFVQYIDTLQSAHLILPFEPNSTISFPLLSSNTIVTCTIQINVDSNHFNEQPATVDSSSSSSSSSSLQMSMLTTYFLSSSIHLLADNTQLLTDIYISNSMSKLSRLPPMIPSTNMSTLEQLGGIDKLKTQLLQHLSALLTSTNSINTGSSVSSSSISSFGSASGSGSSSIVSSSTCVSLCSHVMLCGTSGLGKSSIVAGIAQHFSEQHVHIMWMDCKKYIGEKVNIRLFDAWKII
jgi:hypothetical protein